MRQKLITLCPNSFEIAQKKDNFSAWVRTKLLEEAVVEDGPANNWHYQCPLCHQLKTFPHQELAWRCNKCNVLLECVDMRGE